MKALWNNSKRITKHVFKKSGHYFFPWIIHYLTDKYGNKHHHVVVDTVLATAMIILIAANAGLVYWFYFFAVPVDLKTELIMPEIVISGADITYKMNYSNTTKKLNNVWFEVLLPVGFSYKESNLIVDKSNPQKFLLGDLPKNNSGTLQITGNLIGNTGEVQKIVVITHYNYKSVQFSELVEKAYTISESNLESTINLPEHVLNYQEFEWSVHYKNNSPLNRTNVSFQLDIPDNLEIVNNPENYNNETKTVIIAELQAGQEGDLAFTGIFSRAQGESSNLIGVTTNFNNQSQTFLQERLAGGITVLTPRLTINASAPSSTYIGNSFTYSIVCNNIGDAELRNLVVQAQLIENDNLGFNLYAKYGETNGYNAKWIIPTLGVGETKTVYLVVTAPVNLRKENLQVNLQASAYANIEDLAIITESKTVASSVKYISTLSFQGEVKYYGPSGEQLGYGPYPFKADEITAVRVFWSVRDFSNDLTNVTISTTLPSQVSWTGVSAVTQGGNIYYDSANHKIVWHTSSIPAFSGPQGANFEVRVWPNSQQIGKDINVTNETYFTAQDIWTGTILSKSLGPMRTGKGIQK